MTGLEDGVVKVQTTLVACPGFEPTHRGQKSATTALVAHQLVNNLLVSANRIQRGTLVVILLDRALVGVLEKP